jgi:pantothenate kinase
VSTPVDLEALTGVIRERSTALRSLTAIVGAPGAGKSTLAAKLAAALNTDAVGSAAVLEQDGYHFDDRVLEQRRMRDRKGAPETFDTGGLFHMLRRLKENLEDEVAVPVFDRDIEIARAGARIIPRSVRSIIVEGNYLLLDRQGWRDLRALFDVTVTIVVTEETLRQRLIARWQSFNLSPDEIIAKVEGNDLPNGRLVMGASAKAEFAFG